jgi:hypothetical protein
MAEDTNKPKDAAPERLVIEGGFTLDTATVQAARAAADGIDPQDITDIMGNDAGGTFFWSHRTDDEPPSVVVDNANTDGRAVPAPAAAGVERPKKER